MDDETKSAVAKLVDKFTDVVGNVAAAASSAAQHAMESNARRMEPDAAWIAAGAGEQVYIPERSTEKPRAAQNACPTTMQPSNASKQRNAESRPPKEPAR
jgi:hypothetical protein